MNFMKVSKKIIKYPYNLTKNGLSDLRSYHYLSKKSSKTGHKIKVGFIVQMPELWSKQKSVYERMCHLSLFDPWMVVVPKFDYQNGCIGEYSDEKEFFYSACVNRQCVMAKKDSDWIDIKSLEFDYLFYQRPYDVFLPEFYRSNETVKYTKICYIPYATPEKKDTVIYPRSFFRNIYFGFMEDESAALINAKRYKLTHKKKLQHFCNIGYPAFEECIKQRKDCKYENILWTPRWSYDPVVGGSHFFEYEPYLSEFDWKEQHFMVRPHPMMWENFIRTGKATEQDEKVIKSKWSEHGIEIDSNKSIEDTFRNIDILISDNSSVILMFFLTGKPIIYCIFDVGFGTLFKSIMPGMYIARNWEEVEKYLKMLQNHEDPLKSVRNEIISNNFPQHHNVAEKIVNTIAEDYNRRNS